MIIISNLAKKALSKMQRENKKSTGAGKETARHVLSCPQKMTDLLRTAAGEAAGQYVPRG